MLKDFTKFCKENKELRFWQALVIWANSNCIYVVDRNGKYHDSFYWEYNVLKKENQSSTKSKKNKNTV